MVGKDGNYKAVHECNSSTTCINDCFDNHILTQILCCLPFQSAVACKSVCKLWLSIISSWCFAGRFVSRHEHHHRQQNYLVLNAEGCYFLVNSKITKSNISFSFLPEFPTSEYEIVASLDDMLLLSAQLDQNTSYYFICNPFTKGWVKLPTPPPCANANYCLGFTCEPYNKVKGDRVVTSSGRFRVVRLKVGTHQVAEVASTYQMDIFSSETWQWTTTMMHSPHKFRPIRSTSHNGLLYWMSFFGGVVVHDPFNNTVCCAIRPPRYGLSKCIFRFNISEGSLFAFERWDGSNINVWELEDWNQREWRLRSAITLTDLVINNCEILEWAKDGLTTLALDPSDMNVLFLYNRVGGICTINLKTREFKPRFLLKLPTQFYIFLMPVILGSLGISDHPPVFEIKAPCCPTPISAFFNQAPREPTD